LPNVEPPSDDPDELYIKTDRQFLEDVIAEISTMITSRPSDELRSSNVTIGYQPLPAVRDLRKALGCDDYPTEFRPINLEVDEHPHYASVGCVGDFTDELIIFAYHRQRDCDPGNIPYYLECLEAIGKGRNSALLQEEYVKAVSLGEITQQEIDDAYKFFALSPNANHAEDHIIGIYRSYIESSPKHKDAAKQALMKLGQAKGSLKIQAVANDKVMSYEEALEYFGVVAETPSDLVEAQAIGMVSYTLSTSECPKTYLALYGEADILNRLWTGTRLW
jgi:ubiquitin carboxyl-terminal hydrolase 25/28